MEKPEKFISALLEIHDCVIIPDFGGFVLNEIPARFSGRPNELLPPGKIISFNRSLNVNDGLLANYISKEENISYSEAISQTKFDVENWKNKLSAGEKIFLEGIGSLVQNADQKIVFLPEDSRNYAIVSFGLPSLILTPVEKQNSQKVFQLPAIPRERSENLVIRRSISVAAVAAVFILAFLVVFKNVSENHLYTSNTNPVYKSIQPIASSISKILTDETVKPAASQAKDITTTPVQESASLLPDNSISNSNSMYYVVGGSFKVEANAEKFFRELKEKGFKAQLLNNEDGWFRVSYLTEQDSLKAAKDLKSIKINENRGAWILKF